MRSSPIIKDAVTNYHHHVDLVDYAIGCLEKSLWKDTIKHYQDAIEYNFAHALYWESWYEYLKEVE